jgi:hypothetical protein
VAWRVDVIRAVYDGDRLVGIMETPELAHLVVAAVNDYQTERPRCQHVGLTPWGEAQCGKEQYHEHHAYSPSEALEELAGREEGPPGK